MKRVRAYVGLGANLSDAAATLAAAVRALAALPGARLRGVSGLYLTRPVGVLDQPPFHNAVVTLDVPGGPDAETAALALLAALKSLERALGRQDGERWGPRALDLDLLVFGRHRLRTRRSLGTRSGDTARAGEQWLEVPHPAAAERLFVLAPLAELAPGLVPPGWMTTVEGARRAALEREGEDAARRVGSWSQSEARWRPRPG